MAENYETHMHIDPAAQPCHLLDLFNLFKKVLVFLSLEYYFAIVLNFFLFLNNDLHLVQDPRATCGRRLQSKRYHLKYVKEKEKALEVS